MVCLQTTHCAILLSLLGGRERVTEYRAPQWGQKKVPPSGTGPNRGTSAPPYTPNQYARRREQIPAPSSATRHPTIIEPRNDELADMVLPAKRPIPFRPRSSCGPSPP